MSNYPIWNIVEACIYKSSKSYGVKKDGKVQVCVGTSAEFARVRRTRDNPQTTRRWQQGVSFLR